MWRIRLASVEFGVGVVPAGNGSVIELTRRYEETVKKNQMEK
jgi:hypothetical protein